MGTKPALLVGLAIATAIAAVAPAWASPVDPKADEIMPPPPTFKGSGANVVEHLGAHVPMDALFRTSDGKIVKLGDELSGMLPTILTFNYADCPMLCSLQLDALSGVMPKLTQKVMGPDGKNKISFWPSGQYQIVTIDLESKEPLAKLQKMKERYIARLPKELQGEARKGWTFLEAVNPGDGAQIKRVAESVGFQYVYLPKKAQFAHPAALIFLSPQGKVTRYVYGIEYQAQLMRDSILAAGQAETQTAAGFLCRCYQYDPFENSHTREANKALKMAAGGAIVMLLGGVGLMSYLRKQREHGGPQP